MTGLLESEIVKSEKIGVVGSPSSTSQMRVDIVGSAVAKGLVGSIVFLKYTQDDGHAYALGQITEVTLKNTFLEDPTMRGITKQRGEVPSITGDRDTYAAEMVVSAVFKEEDGGLSPSALGTVPPTGTPIRMISQDIMEKMTEEYADHVVHVGRVFGSDVLLPSWFRHFGEAADGGLGDALHIGIFGKTGSGKSVLGKMLMLSYMMHDTMSILVLDPQGEFSKIGDEIGVRSFADSVGKRVNAYNLSQLTLLPDWELFKKILVDSGFLKSLGIWADDNMWNAADQIVKILRHRPKVKALDDQLDVIKPGQAYKKAAFERVWRALQEPKHMDHIYTRDSIQYKRVQDVMENADNGTFYTTWKSVASLFGRDGGNAHEIGKLLDSIGNKDGNVTVVNLSKTDVPPGIFWSDKIEKVVINQILSKLVDIAQDKFTNGKSLNTMVILDEAHRFAPRSGARDDEDSARLRSTLLDAIRTTRKFGLGWMFISQTLASLDKELLQQLRMYFFGYGLAWGAELQSLKELVGGNNSILQLYRQFHDPESSLGHKKYSFMSMGPSSPLAFSGMPLFFNSLQFPEEFLTKNGMVKDAP